jgi:opacity protein-like surface antigen
MRTIYSAIGRLVNIPVFVPAVLAVALFATSSEASAQGLGIGGRMAWVTADSDADVDSVRFNGVQVRLVSRRWGLEVSMDRRSEEFEALNQKVVETPIQASLLMKLGAGKLSPYLLGGPGWYKRKVQPIAGSDDLDVQKTEFGWHAGAGLEIVAGRHLGLHGDYRYTFLDFGDDDDDDEGIIRGLVPGHKGSMWTLGATIYF